MARIRSLRPNVTRDEAIDQFSSGGPVNLLRQVAFGPVRSVAEFFIPFRLFQVEILNSGRRDQRVLGLDAVTGSLDLYHFEQLPGSGEVVVVETRNYPPGLLDDVRAMELVIAKVRRVLFTTGFFRMRNLEISAQPVPGEICIPYWVGFRGRGTQARFVVMDAVRRRIEGAKVRTLLKTWLTSISKPI
jgi:hypothetical protein